MKTKLVHLFWVFLWLAGCARSEPAVVAPAPVVAPLSSGNALALAQAYEKTECTFSRRGGQGEMECGLLSVPLDRSQPEGEQIKFAVTIIKATAEKPQPEPIVFLSYGGSGGFAFAYRGTLLDRDLILVDARGMGRSEPALTCSEVSGLAGSTLEQSPYAAEVLDRVLAAQQTCYQNWASQGLDLSYFSSAVIAEDLEDLRQALGYERWNLYASGYGARVALLMMRDYPQTIRSVVLESPGALVGDDLAGMAPNIERVLNLFFAACTAAQECNQAFPELQETFYEVVDQLNASPVNMEVSDLNAGRRYQMLVDGDRLIDILVRAVASGNSIVLPEMPRTIYELKSGGYSHLAQLLGGMGASFGYSSSGPQWQVECKELLPQTTPERILSGSSSMDSHLREYFNRQYAAALNTCEMLKDAKDSPALNEIAASDIPTLILYGDRNPYSSPSWSERVAGMLSHAYAVQITGAGSGGGFDRSRGDCSRGIASAFLEDPTSQPDTACAAEKPDYTWVTLP